MFDSNYPSLLAAPSPSPSLSKSQTNLAGLASNPSRSPILSLIASSLAQKSSSLLVSAANSAQLMDATFMQIDSLYLAEQLTYIDKCLFPKG